MKKKIVFMVINMNVGGTEKALLNMINEMPKDQYEITILMLEKYGGFLDAIPKEVRVEYLYDYAAYKDLLNRPVKITVKNLFKQGQIGKGIVLGSVHVLSRIFQNKFFYYNFVLKKMPRYKNKYDIAIAYAGPMDFISYFVAKKIKAKKRIQWIHFDVTKIGFDERLSKKLYNMFDKIFVVSNEAEKKLVRKVPSIKGKIEVFVNVVSQKTILSQSNSGNGFEDDFDGKRILTVGRLSKEKGQDLAIKVLARLVKEGHKVKWYCIGEGKARSEYEQLISQLNVEEHFVLLGAKSNPYPYIKQCDLYVQPSRYEGYCITLIEARCLKKPIVTTDVNGANEQIKQGITGVIVNKDEGSLYKAVNTLIMNSRLMTNYSNNLSNEQVDSDEVKKLLKFIK
jgi:glycosyltransferase involved in cell wall biosynthesis